VLAVSEEPADLVGPYVERHGLRMPVAAGSTSRYAYGINAFPTAVLIGPDGRIAWKGHYTQLSDRVLAKVLEDVVLGSPLAFKSEVVWEGRVAEAARLASEGELKKAFAAATAILTLGDEAAADKAQAKRLESALTAHVTELVKTARAGLGKDPIGSWRLVEELAGELEGHALHGQMKTFLEELTTQEPLATEIEARKALDAALKVLNKRGLNRARGKLEAIVQRYSGTEAALDARAMLRR
jgi:hypothetical protein